MSRPTKAGTIAKRIVARSVLSLIDSSIFATAQLSDNIHMTREERDAISMADSYLQNARDAMAEAFEVEVSR